MFHNLMDDSLLSDDELDIASRSQSQILGLDSTSNAASGLLGKIPTPSNASGINLFGIKAPTPESSMQKIDVNSIDDSPGRLAKRRRSSRLSIIEEKANPMIEAMHEHTHAMGPASDKLI